MIFSFYRTLDWQTQTTLWHLSLMHNCLKWLDDALSRALLYYLLTGNARKSLTPAPGRFRHSRGQAPETLRWFSLELKARSLRRVRGRADDRFSVECLLLFRQLFSLRCGINKVIGVASFYNTQHDPLWG